METVDKTALASLSPARRDRKPRGIELSSQAGIKGLVHLRAQLSGLDAQSTAGAAGWPVRNRRQTSGGLCDTERGKGTQEWGWRAGRAGRA